MKKTKIMAVIMTLCMAASVTACGPFKINVTPKETEESTEVSDTSVSEETTEESTTTAEETEETWTCINGHSGNTGNFCVECGEAKDAEATTSEETTAEETTVEETTAEETTAEETTAEETTAEETTAEETTVEETTAEETTAEETTAAETTVEETTAEETTAAETTAAETTAEPAKLGNFINYKDMHFFINGKKYTLGKTTLQEMIDDGVPFDENDIANADNNIKKNYQSGGFRIKLDKYWSAQVSVLNPTKGNKKMSQCYINKIYFPNNPDQTQNILSFDFPVTMSKEDLIAAVGKPKKDNYRHYEDDNSDYYTDTYTYKGKAKKYIRASNYVFEFTNEKLRYVTIEYMP